jgi:hypothetical protein
MRERISGQWRFYTKSAALAVFAWVLLFRFPVVCQCYAAMDAAQCRCERAGDALCAARRKDPDGLCAMEVNEFMRAQDQYLQAAAHLREQIPWLL